MLFRSPLLSQPPCRGRRVLQPLPLRSETSDLVFVFHRNFSFPFLSSRIIQSIKLNFLSWVASPSFLSSLCFSFCDEACLDAFAFRWQCPAEALSLPLRIPLKTTIQRLKKKVLHLTKKSKKMEGELRRLREGHSEATAEATRFQNLHVKGIMEYIRRKADFAKELKEYKKSASDRI